MHRKYPRQAWTTPIVTISSRVVDIDNERFDDSADDQVHTESQPDQPHNFPHSEHPPARTPLPSYSTVRQNRRRLPVSIEDAAPMRRRREGYPLTSRGSSGCNGR